MFNLTKTALLDLIERTIRTFVGVFVPLLIAGGVASDDTVIGTMSVWQNAAVAGLSAAGTVVLSFVLGTFGPKNGTTSLVPDVIDADVIRALPPVIPEP